MGTYISIKRASELLDVSQQRVRTLCRDGTLEAEKPGNSWLVDAASLSKYGLKTAHILAEDHGVYRVSGSKPIALSFFSGALGLDLGIEQSGFEVRLACESDKFCRQTIALNRPDIALLGDINDVSADEVRESAGLGVDEDIDLIVGGPPCQAFSTAGRRKGFNDERGNVFLKYLDLCIELNPKYFVIENVRGLLSCPMDHRPHDKRGEGFPELHEDELKGGALNFVVNRIKSSGYAFSFNLYNAANFGTPQIRERLIIVCSRDGKRPPFLAPTNSEDGAYGLKKWNDFESCIGGLDAQDHLNFPNKRLKYYRMLGPGQNWKNLPKEMQKEAMGKSYFSGGGKTGFLRRLAWNRPAPTLVTHPAMPATDLAHPEEDRPLSIQEYKRIQQFPDGWELAGPLVQQYKQVGNAVPVGLGYAVGNLIMNLIQGIELIQPSDFKYSRYKRTSDIEWMEDFDEIRYKSQSILPSQQKSLSVSKR